MTKAISRFLAATMATIAAALITAPASASMVSCVDTGCVSSVQPYAMIVGDVSSASIYYFGAGVHDGTPTTLPNGVVPYMNFNFPGPRLIDTYFNVSRVEFQEDWYRVVFYTQGQDAAVAHVLLDGIVSESVGMSDGSRVGFDVKISTLDSIAIYPSMSQQPGAVYAISFYPLSSPPPVVPEPGSLALVGLALAILAFAGRSRPAVVR